MSFPGPGFEPRFDLDDLRHATQQPAWLELQPNYPCDSDIVPANLPPEVVLDIVNTSLTAAEQPVRDTVVTGAYVDATYLGEGETKYCLEVTGDAGRLVAQILLTRPNMHEPVVIPEDSHFTMINDNPGRALWEYSDARVYAELALTNEYTMRLTEHAGSPVPMWPLTALQRTLAQRRAWSAVTERFSLDPRDGFFAKKELEKDRHQLSKDGKYLVIDVPVNHRKPPTREADS
jgi:hypothetical protein